MSKGHDEKPEDFRRLFRRFQTYVSRYRRMIILALVCMVVHAVCRQFPIYATGLMVDRVIVGEKDAQKVRDAQVEWMAAVRSELERVSDGGAPQPDEAADILDKKPDHLDRDVDDVIAGFDRRRETLQRLTLHLETLKAGETIDRAAIRRDLEYVRDQGSVEQPPTDDRFRWLIIITLGLVITAGIGAGTYFINEYFFKWLATRVIVDIRAELMAHLLRLPLPFFHKSRMGDVYSRLTNDVQATFRTVNIYVSELLLLPMMILSATAVAFIASWKLALLIVPFAPVVIIPSLRIGARVKKSAKKGFESLGDAVHVMKETIEGIRIVKGFRAEDAEAQRFLALNERFMKRSMKVVKHKASGRSIMEFTYSAAIAMFLFGGGWMLIHDGQNITPGELVMFVAAIAAIYRPTRRLAQAYNNFQEALAASGRVFELLDEKAEPEDPPGALVLTSIEEGIRFEDVTFSYGDSEQSALRNVSFEIGRGETVALVGRSGSGKSTAADLIARFYRPQSGRITIDGIDVTQISKTSYLERIAIVSQQPFIFNASVRENIMYGRKGASNEDMIAAARAAGIHDVIDGLSEGYDTVVGERGANLSGGELQRMTIARAVLRHADLLILDEATSALDSHNERLVQDAIDSLARNSTALIIAHRFSTVQNADRIVVLEDGEVREVGRHADLLEKGGIYAELYELQLRR